jgi:hypothetical protein
MHLNPSEVARFYNIWFPLLYYVNQHTTGVPNFPEKWGDASVAPAVALPVRDALWQRDDLREAFIAENPAQLSASDLALVESWKHRVAGKFFIFRHLKKYSILIGGAGTERAYGVVGLTDSLEDIAGPYLPIYVNAVLIPFEDRIIYDSLLTTYAVQFGGGYKQSLNETYRNLQEREGIITQLPADVTLTPAQAQASNKKVLAAFQKALGASGLSLKMIQEHTATVTDFTHNYLENNTPPQTLLTLTAQDLAAYRDAGKGKINTVSFKRLITFLRDSDRLEWDEADSLLDFIKQEL